MVLDTHIHAPHFLPRHAWKLYRRMGGPTMPPDSGLDTLAAGGVDGAVVKAVGDSIATWFHPVRRRPAVLHQLDGIRSQAALADAQIVIEQETRGVIGGNFLRVLDVVVDGARPAGQV